MIVLQKGVFTTGAIAGWDVECKAKRGYMTLEEALEDGCEYGREQWTRKVFHLPTMKQILLGTDFTYSPR